MRDYLAEKLLAKVMAWNPEDVAKERPVLQALAAFKYDEYHQYSPGMRFIESLACWLEQFDPGQKRKLAYQFVRSRLIFISDNEIEHLVSIAFRDEIRPFLMKQAASRMGIAETAINRIEKSIDYKIVLRQSLFLGLSDGARIDIFRRHSRLDHEQVFPTYQITKEKSEEFVRKLRISLKKTNSKSKQDELFKIIFLIDDFSASDISFIRRENGGLGGKINKFYN